MTDTERLLIDLLTANGDIEMSLHENLANCHPSLQRGMVWCRTCGRSESVKAAGALQHGWPMCCGYTMTIDSPEEQKKLAAKGS